MKLTDVGTRYEHYRELLDLWEQGYEILQRRTSHSGVTIVPTKLMQLMNELEGAIALMTEQLNIQSDIYMNMLKVADEVNGVQQTNLLTEGSELNKPYDGTA